MFFIYISRFFFSIQLSYKGAYGYQNQANKYLTQVENIVVITGSIIQGGFKKLMENA